MTLYQSVADLPLTIDGYSVEQRQRDTSSGFTRTTTVVAVEGAGVTGHGEDVTYATEAHDALSSRHDPWPLSGNYTLDSYSRHVGTVDLFPDGSDFQEIFRNYRRWALESAGLDLALKQRNTSLGAVLNRGYSPVRFVVSTRLGDPPTLERLDRLQAINADLEFKLDPTSQWTGDLITAIADRGSVVSLDLKGQYEDTIVDQAADPVLYERVIEAFPDALLEDPALTSETRPLFEGHEDRVTWDYPIRGIDSIEALPWTPGWLNIKPSRFGSVASLLSTIEYCEANDIRLFGGGQFELGVGRTHLHTLASLCYPDAPNDIAPRGYNDLDPDPDVPKSPLDPPTAPTGLAWN